MNEFTIKPQELIDLLVKYAPTIGPYFFIYPFSQSLKEWFKIKGNRVYSMVFLVSCAIAYAQMVVEKANFPINEYISWVLIRGATLSGVSWLCWFGMKFFFRKGDGHNA